MTDYKKWAQKETKVEGVKDTMPLPEETSLLGHLAEECAEVIHVVGKILRHGWHNSHPDYGNVPNSILLVKELADIEKVKQQVFDTGKLSVEKKVQHNPPPGYGNVPTSMAKMDPTKMRALSHVPRWAICHTHKQQNVAEHSFHVAWIYLWLCHYFELTYNPVYLVEALVHDQDEADTGDIPTPKDKTECYSDWSAHKLLVKLADRLEGLLLLQEEADMGNNRHEIEVYTHDGLSRVGKTLDMLHDRGIMPIVSPDSMLDALYKAVYPKS